ncbi:fimbrial protein [Erwiniaceae bacterium CAU 1747]
MKKILFALGLLSGISTVVAQAADSTITITGNVIDNTCRVSTASQDFTVDLQKYSTKRFFKQGSASEMVPFSLIFTSCGSAATGVRVGFNGVTLASDNTLLKNDAAVNAAGGMGIQILNADKNVIVVNQETNSIDWSPVNAGSPSTINFYARMVANDYPVTAGLVRATATMTLEFQ